MKAARALVARFHPLAEQPALHLSPERVQFGVQTGILFATHGADKALGLLSSILMARYFGAEGLGVIGAALVLGAIAQRFTEMGIPVVLQREMAKHPAAVPDLLASGLGLRGLLNLAMLLVLAGYARLTAASAEGTTIILLAGLSNVFTGWSHLLAAVWAGSLRMGYVAVSQVVYRILYTVGVVAVVALRVGPVPLMAALVTAAALQLALALGLTGWRFFTPRIALGRHMMMALIAQAWVLGLAAMMAAVYDRVDTLIASWYLDDHLVGNYYAAYNVYLTVLPFALAFNNVAFSVLSGKATQSIAAVTRAYRVALLAIGALGAVAGLGLLVGSGWIVPLLYGEEFRLTATCLRVLSLAVPLVFANNLNGVTLNAIGRQKVALAIVAVGVVVNVGLNLVLIPRWGVTAPAVVTVVTEAVILTVTLGYLVPVFRRESRRAAHSPVSLEVGQG